MRTSRHSVLHRCGGTGLRHSTNWRAGARCARRYDKLELFSDNVAVIAGHLPENGILTRRHSTLHHRNDSPVRIGSVRKCGETNFMPVARNKAHFRKSQLGHFAEFKPELARRLR